MAHDNEDGPVHVPGKGYRWQNSVYGERMIAAERQFWGCEQIQFDDVLRVEHEWERMPCGCWARKYIMATSNRYGDMFEGEFRIYFKEDSAEWSEITVR